MKFEKPYFAKMVILQLKLMNDYNVMTILEIFKNSLEAFSDAYKYSEFDFYKLKGEIIRLLGDANAKGYDNPAYCDLSINVKSAFETDVIIQVFYRNTDGRFYRFKRILDIGKLVNIPHVVVNELGGKKEIIIKLSDLYKLYEVKEEDIIPTVDFNNLYIFSFKNAKFQPKRKEVYIHDELFYYIAEVSYIYDHGERETRRKYYGKILNLPKDIIDKISSSEDHSCLLDVTNS